MRRQAAPRRRIRRIARWVTAASASVGLVAVTAVITIAVVRAGDAPIAGGVSSDSAVVDAPTSAHVVALDNLTVVTGESEASYDRDLFGQRWADVDRNGCDTRNDILRRDMTELELKADTNGCKVLAGTLTDPYSGDDVAFVSGEDTSRLVQIDHIVPLSWAWRHGADAWKIEQRTEFANDPLNLQATTESMNQSKGDSGPSRWLPAQEPAYCGYAERFVQVLAKWELGIGSLDRAVVRGILIECAGSGF